jgi:hypothetical protein
MKINKKKNDEKKARMGMERNVDSLGTHSMRMKMNF